MAGSELSPSPHRSFLPAPLPPLALSSVDDVTSSQWFAFGDLALPLASCTQGDTPCTLTSVSARPAGSPTSRKHPAPILANHLVDMVHLPKQSLCTTKQ